MLKWLGIISLSLVLMPKVNGAVAGSSVTKPMKYAVTDSKLFAEGDTSDPSGWRGCFYDESQSDALTIIECDGAREVLVHGGHRVKAQFVCRYIFEPDIESGSYSLEFQSCE